MFSVLTNIAKKLEHASFILSNYVYLYTYKIASLAQSDRATDF